MSGLLVSVRDLEEAKTACLQNIAILDVKNPERGALGAADPYVLLQILNSGVGKQVPKSFSAGELSDWVSENSASFEMDWCSETLTQCFSHVKVGLAKMAGIPRWQTFWCELFSNRFPGMSAVAVSYLDSKSCNAPSPEEVISVAGSADFCDTILFDTYEKTGNLFDHASSTELAKLIETSKSKNLRTVIAGSVDASCLESVLRLQPDLVGVRGAVCQGSRESKVDGRLIEQIVCQMFEFNSQNDNARTC